MSNENPTGHGDDHAEDIKRWLTIGNSVALVLVLFVITISSVLIFGLRSDVAALEDQARKSAKAAKALQEELASVKERLQMAGSPVAAGGGKPTNIDAVDTSSDCVIRSGSKGGLPDCIKGKAQE